MYLIGEQNKAMPNEDADEAFGNYSNSFSQVEQSKTHLNSLSLFFGTNNFFLLRLCSEQNFWHTKRNSSGGRSFAFESCTLRKR